MTRVVVARDPIPAANGEGLPAEWRVVRLDAVADLLSGGTPSKSRPEWWEGRIPWASPKDMKRLRLLDVRDHVSEDALIRHGSRLVPAKTIFVVVRGMVLAKELPVAMTEVPMAFNQDMKAVLARDEADPEYLLYALASRRQALIREIGTSAHGTRRIGSSSLEALLLPLPPKREQIAIATVLRGLEAAVETQGRIVATLKELKTATMAKLFREGLGGGVAQTRMTPFGEVPKDWATALLGEYAKVQTGIAKGRALDGATVEVPYLRVANVQDGYFDLSEIKTIQVREGELRRHSLQRGDVLLTEGGDFDKLGRGYLWSAEIQNCIHQNHIFAVRTDRARLLPEFFAYLAQSPYGKAYFLSVAHKTTNLACINSSKLKAFPLVLPDLSAQRGIATVVMQMDESLAIEIRRLQTFKSVFSSMLGLLITGRVRVQSEARVGGEVTAKQAQASQEDGTDITPATLSASLERFVAELIRRFDPERVILFRRHAEGSPSAEGAVGLLVVMDFEGRALAEAVRIEREIEHDFALEVMVRRPEEIRCALERGNPLIKRIVEGGNVLYARPDAAASVAVDVGLREPARRVAPKGKLSDETLREIVRRVVEAVAPEKIILFGSAARGEMGPDSDVDLLVVKSGVDRLETARAVRRSLLGIGMPKDVIAVTPEDLSRYGGDRSRVIFSALREGKIVYAA